MNRLLRVVFGLGALAVGWGLCVPAHSQQNALPAPGAYPPGFSFAAVGGDGQSHFPDFNTVTKGSKEIDGLFKLHQKDEHLYAEIRQDQFDRPLLCPIAVAKGAGLGGMTLNGDEEWVLVFKRVGDKVQLIRRNVRFKARGTATTRAVQNTYADSVLMALRIHALNPMRNTVLINLNDIFMTDFAQLGLGFFDANRSTWGKIKAFPHNLELEVTATYGGGGGRFSGFGAGGDSVIDARGRTVVLHYGLVSLQESGYQPRLADTRVGHFLSAVKEFGRDDKDTSFVRYVNRWRLERADGSAWKEGGKLVPPKKKIVFWVEKTVPEEYRPIVRDGIMEWNKAFEKVGFRDAIEVRQQEDTPEDDFDPEDLRYATFRWITTDVPFAIGPSRANPLTGEILDADILFDASWLQYWKHEAKVLARPSAAGREIESASPIEELDMRLDASRAALAEGRNPNWNDRARPQSEEEMARLRMHALQLRQGLCQCTAHKHYELGLAAMALAQLPPMPPPGKPGVKPGDKPAEKPSEKDKAAEEMIAQAIKEVVMHEVGHTLGLRHNFKASSMLKNEQLHDVALTRKQGLVGSVMDYAPVNLAPKGVKQGDYFTTTLGPYDYWAIEYAYKPLAGGTEGEVEELKKIASKAALPGLDYGTDEDRGAVDPLINVYDLGDPMTFGKERILLTQELLKDLDRVVNSGDSYQRARTAFDVLLAQYGNAGYLVSRFVGGEFMHRDHKGDPSGRDPFVTVPAAKQREALKFLQENLLTDKPFQFSPQLLRRLAADRWYHWGDDSMYSSVEYPIYDRVLNIQRVVLRNLLNPGRLARIQTNALKAEKEDPLTVAEVFRTLTDGVWGELGAAPTKSNGSALTIRRNLQREHMKDLTTLVLGSRAGDFGLFVRFGGGGATPADAKSLARMHLREIDRKVETTLKEKGATLDDTCRAHLEECHERIAKVLNASMQLND